VITARLRADDLHGDVGVLVHVIRRADPVITIGDLSDATFADLTSNDQTRRQLDACGYSVQFLGNVRVASRQERQTAAPQQVLGLEMDDPRPRNCFTSASIALGFAFSDRYDLAAAESCPATSTRHQSTPAFGAFLPGTCFTLVLIMIPFPSSRPARNLLFRKAARRDRTPTRAGSEASVDRMSGQEPP
jgi:hypothetical protein